MRPFDPPTLREDLPIYPPPLQLLRLSGGTIAGPSGYATSSVLGPSLYLATTQQLHPTTLLPRDREPCLALDVNRYGLTPGYYLGRLSGSYQSLPLYEVGGAPVTAALSPSGSGLTSLQQQQLSTLSPTQTAILNNLTPCQLQTLFEGVPLSDIHTLTSGVLTATELANLINQQTPTEFGNLYHQLTTSQVITLTENLNQQEIQTLTQTLTAPQIQQLITNLTVPQLQALTTLSSSQIKTLYSNLTFAQLKSYLDATYLFAAFNGVNAQTGTSYTFLAADFNRLVTISNASASFLTLPAASSVGPGWSTLFQNIGAGTATITPSSGLINGLSSLSVASGQGAIIVSDGTDWRIVSPVAGATGLATYSEGSLVATGSVQGDAAQIVTTSVNVTGADGTKGVILPNSTGAIITVWNNDGTNNLNVYPPVGAALGTTGVNVALAISLKSVTVFHRVTSAFWTFSTFTSSA